MKVLVCGGRDFNRVGDLHIYMNAFHQMTPITLLIHGDAPGADTVAGNWAKSHGVAVKAFPADWKGLGRKAGPIRNKQMLDEAKPDVVVAFPGGKGTSNMIGLALAASVPVIQPMATNAVDPSAPS